MPARFKTALWLAWAAIAVVLTSGIVRWHVEYFRSPGPQFYRAALIGLPLLAVGALAWSRLRTGFLWRYELAAIAAIPAVAALLREPRATLVIAASLRRLLLRRTSLVRALRLERRTRPPRICSSPRPPDSRC